MTSTNWVLWGPDSFLLLQGAETCCPFTSVLLQDHPSLSCCDSASRLQLHLDNITVLSLTLPSMLGIKLFSVVLVGIVTKNEGPGILTTIQTKWFASGILQQSGREFVLKIRYMTVIRAADRMLLKTLPFQNISKFSQGYAWEP